MKPTVFLSHSSADRTALTALKRVLNKKTGNAVQFFLSADGQSIPLGENWVQRIHQALNDTAMMLVFLSRASVTSRWIHFEAGYTYAKGVRVIPIAFAGVNIAELSPPISLLQGFNLRGADGLNKIIALVNQQFDLNFSEDFSNEDYAQIFAGLDTLTNSSFSAMEFVSEIELEVPGDPSRMLTTVATALTAAGIEYSADDTDLRTFGATFTTARRRGEIPRVEARIEPSSFEEIRCAADALLSLSRGGARLRLIFFEYVDRVKESHKISALLRRAGANIDKNDSFRFGNVTFTLTGREVFDTRDHYDRDDDETPKETPVLEFILESDNVGSVPFEVAELLWSRRVLRMT